MKFVPNILFILAVTLITIPCLAKRPKKEKPEQNIIELIKEEKEEEKTDHTLSGGYHPNPVILAGVGQIMNGALSIASNPHSRPNIGHSVASMIHGIMSIVIEKVAHKKIDIADRQALEDCFEQVYADINKEITEIIATKNLADFYN